MERQSVDFVKQFPLDALHIVDEGVTKAMVNAHYLKLKRKKKLRMASLYSTYKGFIPKKFAGRKLIEILKIFRDIKPQNLDSYFFTQE